MGARRTGPLRSCAAARRLAALALAGLLGHGAYAEDAVVMPGPGAPVPWFADGAVRARVLLAALAEAPAEGLRSSAYPTTVLAERVAADERDTGLAEALTRAYLAYAADLCCGRVTELPGEQAAYARAPDVAPESLLELARNLHRGADLAARLRPAHAAYAKLRAALARYRAVAQAGGWPALPADGKIDPAAPDVPAATLIALHARLHAEDGRMAALPDGAMPDRAALVDAVKRFQADRGLDPDGVVGPATRRALGVPVAARIEQIELALERQRWPDAALADGIEVNIPAYTLVLRQAGQVRLESAVVVGRADWPTPVFETRAVGLDLHPHWNMPTSIVRAELLPKVRRDPDYLVAQGIDVLSGWGQDAAVLDPSRLDWSGPKVAGLRYRQRPGPRNPLGALKVHMPNRYAVFLHDTPSRGLFARDRRALSHGCVRVARVVELAALLVDRYGADAPGNVPTLLGSAQARRVSFARPVLVRMVYRTAWADAHGAVHFRDDIYGRDRALARALLGEGLRPAAGADHNPAGR